MSSEVLTSISLLETIKSKLSKTLPVSFLRDILSYSYSKQYSIESDLVARSQVPNLVFRNPIARDILLREISVIFDDNYSAKGTLIITLKDAVIYELDKDADFKNTQSLQLSFKEPRNFAHDAELKFYVWNKIDALKIKADILISIGE